MAARELPKKRLRERVAERKAREAERPTTMLDHIVGSLTPGKSVSYGDEKPERGEVWRGYATKGGYILMALSLIFLIIQIMPIVRGDNFNPNWMALVVFAFIFLIGRALIFVARFMK